MALATITQKLERWSTFSQLERFYVLDGDPQPVEPAAPARFELHRTWSEDFQAMLDHIRGGSSLDRARIERGDACVVVLVDGAPACFGWASPGRWGGAGTQRPLAPDAFFAYDVMTHSAFRGLRLAPARAVFMATAMARLGYPRSCTTVRDSNVASQQSIRKVGYVRTDYTVRVYRMRLMSILQSGGPPPSFLP